MRWPAPTGRSSSADIDEVVLEFVAPFMAFLESHGHEYRPTSFRLTGNVYFKETGQPVDNERFPTFLSVLR
jgi:hypothetical protein